MRSVGYPCLLAMAILGSCDDGMFAAQASSQQASSVLGEGFVEQLVVNGLPDVTTMKFAPDGRLFAAQKTGALRIVKDGRLLDAPFLTLAVGTDGERGLDGFAFDPSFATNGRVYVYYTAAVPDGHDRLSRFTVDPSNPDRAVQGSEVVLLEIAATASVYHNGGALTFLPDGTLTVAIGDNLQRENAQALSDLHGKVLRFNADGSIPTDNPFYSSTTGENRAIWAVGFRNPFTASLQPGTGRLFVNDVGLEASEEINDVVAGANYGWPMCEGPCAPPIAAFRDPIAAYDHGLSDTTGCAITGGTFYAPVQPTFPPMYRGKYFYIDFCSGWIRWLDPVTRATSLFATKLPPSNDTTATEVALETGPDGALYFANRFRGAIYRIQYTGSGSPQVGQSPANVSLANGQQATFEVRASGTAPLAYAWRRNGVPVTGATQAILTMPSVTVADSGARFDCVVSNALGSATSAASTLTVSPNRSPEPVISQPLTGLRFNAGDTIEFAGAATDPEDGSLPGSRLTWEVRFQHESHFHPFIPAQSGVTHGAFTIPITGETDPVIWYRILLTATDANGATTTTFRDVLPNLVALSFATDPPGLNLLLDGAAVTSGFSTQAVVGLQRTLSVARSQNFLGAQYVFDHWSDGDARQHSFRTPATDRRFTATFFPLDTNHYGAEFMAWSVPHRMDAGARANVSVTFRNTGLTTWSAANGYRVGSQNPHDGLTWGTSRAEIPSSVAPGETVTVTFQIRAPARAGEYAFQWRLLQEGVTWFGEPTTSEIVIVEGTAANDSVIVSEQVPETVLPGMPYTARVAVRNTGTATWDPAAGYVLGSQGPADNFNWGNNRVALPGPVPAGTTVTVNVPISAPWTTGPVAFQWRMLQENVEWFGATTSARMVNVVPVGNSAAFVSQALPPVVLVGQSYDAVVTMKNIGTTTWDPGALYALGSQSPDDSVTWGFAREYEFRATPPGQTAVFNLHITAPWTPGPYDFQWRMRRENVEWFGQPSPRTTVNVGVGADAALFVAQSVPPVMQAGSHVVVSVTMKNIGTATWGAMHRLGSTNPRDNMTWGTNRAFLSSPVLPGQTTAFSFTVTAPATPGTYSFRWAMVDEGVAWFGPSTEPFQVTVH